MVAVGTGRAIRNARNGDGDVLLVHAKEDEQNFVDAGYGTERLDVMYNDFVIVGPPDDPAAIASMTSAPRALAKIAKKRVVFASRGIDSGTHKKELELWRQAGVDPAPDSGKWYRETGSGMGTTLNIGIGMNAYVLSDRATWMSFGNKANHRILVEGDTALHNQYGVIAINIDKHPRVNARDAQTFVDWITGPRVAAIGEFKPGGTQIVFSGTRARAKLYSAAAFSASGRPSSVTPSSIISPISTSLNPASRKISILCSPNTAGSLRISEGVFENLIGGSVNRSFPSVG